MAKKTYQQLEMAEEKIEKQKRAIKKMEMEQTIQRAVRTAMKPAAKRKRRG